MGLFTPRLGTVFASRWKALWWASSILATAYCTVQGLPGDGDAAKMAKMVDGKKADHHAPKNPWALDKTSGEAGKSPS